MYHNNKDNSIKTPIIARYNTPRRDTRREYSVYLSYEYETRGICGDADMWDAEIESNIPRIIFLILTTCDVFAETFTGRVRAWPRFTSSKYPRADVGTNLPSWPGRIKTICWSETRLRPDTASELGPGGVARSGHPWSDYNLQRWDAASKGRTGAEQGWLVNMWSKLCMIICFLSRKYSGKN